MANYMEIIEWSMEDLTDGIQKKQSEMLSHLEWVIKDLSRMKEDIESGNARNSCDCGNSINSLMKVSQLALEIRGAESVLAVSRMALKSVRESE